MVDIWPGLLLIIFLLGFVCWYGYILVGEFLMAGPYIPTRNSEINEMLSKLKLQKGKVFMELGSGDGRVVRTAVKIYGVKGVGIEMHPLVCWWSRILNKIQKVKDISIICGSFYDRELPVADYYYIYLTPKGTNEIGKRLFSKMPKGKMVISKGFKMDCLNDKLMSVIEVGNYQYYYYVI